MTTPRRPSAAAQRRAAAAEADPAAEAPADAAPPADAPDAPADAPDDAPDAPDDAPDAPTGEGADAEAPTLVERAKARLGLGGGDDDGDDAATDGPEAPSSDGEQTCVHPTCEDPTIPAGEEYFIATRGPAQGPMHQSCSHKTIPIRR